MKLKTNLNKNQSSGSQGQSGEVNYKGDEAIWG